MANASLIPSSILWAMQKTIPIDKGECYTNCGLATLLTSGGTEYSEQLRAEGVSIEYALGILTPPGHEPVLHAWLKATSEEGMTFWDPTLQTHSRLWNQSNPSFTYELKYLLSGKDLVSSFASRYPGVPVNDYGIPHGLCRFPVINERGDIE